jgi:hypothetical protein
MCEIDMLPSRYHYITLSLIFSRAEWIQPSTARRIARYVLYGIFAITPVGAIAQEVETSNKGNARQESGNAYRDLGKAVECTALKAASVFDTPSTNGTEHCKTSTPSTNSEQTLKGKKADAVRSCKVIKKQTNPVPVTIQADNLNEFFKKVESMLGNPHMQPDFSWSSINSENGIDLVLTLNTKIIVPRLGMNRATESERATMERAIEFIKEHEERHRAISNAIADQMCQVKGLPIANAQARAKNLLCNTHPAQQAQLDAKEGTITPVQDNKSGRFSAFKISGAKHDYIDTKCPIPFS